jgi:hypothetical protein
LEVEEELLEQVLIMVDQEEVEVPFLGVLSMFQKERHLA